MIPSPARLLVLATLAGSWAPTAVGAQAVTTTPGDAGAGAVVVGAVVDDATGAAVADALLHFEGPDTVRVLTSADGGWTAGSLEPGVYRIAVSRLGYEERTLTARVPVEGGLRVELSSLALPLEALIVTASRRLQRLADAPVSVEVFRAEELRRSGASDLASILTERTGMQLQGGHPNGAGVMLQGLDSERVLILVDGQPWIGRLSGTADLSRIPTSMIERVEVVKGPQAALYGSEAMGGVVNVITRRPGAGWGGSASITSGSQGRLDTSARLTARRGDLGFGVDVGRRTEDLLPGQGSSSAASVVRRDGRASASWSGEGPLALDASLLLVDEDQRWATGQLRHFADNVQGMLTLDGRWTGEAHTLGAAVHASRFDHLLRRGTQAVAPPESSGDRQIQSLAELDLMWGWDPGGDLVLDAGMELGRERIEAETVSSGERDRVTVEPYAQATLDVAGVSVVPGLRYSHSSLWGGHWTPRLALMKRPIPALAVRASVSAGYRAPSFKELGLDFLNSGPGFGYLVRGNPDLQPETSTNLSAGVEWTGLRAYGRVQGFHNAFDRFIETSAVGDSAGMTVYTYGNIAEGRTSGVEIELGWTPGPLELEAGYALLDTEDSSTGQALLGRPRHSGRVSLGLPLGGLRAHTAGTWTGATPMTRDPDSGTVSMRDGYLRFDARVAHRLMDRLDLAVGVDNILDAAPEAWPGFTGRRIHLTLSSTFLGTSDP